MFARLVVFVCVLAFLQIGCGDSRAPVPEADLSAERFATRGKITSIDGNSVEILHEHIAKLRLADGSVGEMPPMAMQFSATTAAPIRGLAVGDAVTIEFTTHYREPPRLRLVAIDKLPAGTKLAIPE